MGKYTFEDFLMEKHAEQYIGTKDCMVDSYNDWVDDLGWEMIEHANKFQKKVTAELLEALVLILPLAEGYVVKHQVGSNQRYIEVAEQAITKTKGGKSD